MLPKLVIVGRPNVGKSSLMNMLANRRISIVDPTAGVTRDRVTATVEVPPATRGGEPTYAEVIDTGGYGIDDVQDLTADVERQISRGIAEADLVLFVVDVQSGVLPLDVKVAEVLRKSARNVPVMLVANKVDGERYEPEAFEAMQLGFGEPVTVSATTGHNKLEFYEALREKIPAMHDADPPRPPDAGVLLAIVGKRNAGKSTLVNALAGDDRVIVSELEGTTRDSIDVRFEIDGHVFTAIDTAGVRKRKSIQDDVEYYSHHRAMRSVRRADVCLLLIDAAVPVSQVDKQLVNEIRKHFRPTVIVVNKWDLAQQQSSQEEYAEYLDDALKGLGFAPIVFTSAIHSEGIKDVLGMAIGLHQQAHHRVGTSELNRVIESIMAERGPSSKGGRRARIYYATQVGENPPTIAMFVNDPDLFDHNYQLFLLNRMRDVLPYSEVPIRLLIRGRDHMSDAERAASKHE